MQKWAFCLEQTLGHRAHGQNLEGLAGAAAAQIDIFRVEYQDGRLPLPWAVRGSIAARRAVASTPTNYDLAFYHTQTVSLLARHTSNAPRYVVSVDATPVQMDAIGTWYGHSRGKSAVEWGKRRWYRRVFAEAAGLVAWSQWAADSLIQDYKVSRDKILVAHPGATGAFFACRDTRREGKRPRILFVGGDFERKGGRHLLEAFESVSPEADLLIVGDADIPVPVGATQERGVLPASQRLLDAYAGSDIFCLPTLADCTPVVVGEAMAAGLPVITTRVGSNAETVSDGETGLLVEPGNTAQLAHALALLVRDASRRREMGRAAQQVARARYSAEANAGAVFRFMAGLA